MKVAVIKKEEAANINKVSRIMGILASCGITVQERREDEIITNPVDYYTLIECAEKLVGSGVVAYDELFQYTPMSGNMCEYKLGISL